MPTWLILGVSGLSFALSFVGVAGSAYSMDAPYSVPAGNGALALKTATQQIQLSG